MSISSPQAPSTHPVGFTTDFELPPPPGSPPSAAAEYLLEVDMGGLFSRDDGSPLPPRQLKAVCGYLGFNWKSVSPLFRAMRAAEFSKWIEDPIFSVSADGIVVNESLVERMKEHRLLPLCPRPLTGWDLHNFSRHYSVIGLCNKSWCPRCGVRKLGTILGHVKRVITPLSKVYTAVATHEPTLASRMGTRRGDHAAEMFWYHRTDGMVAYVSTKPLGGRKSPREWTERTPKEAIEWLVTEVMTFPSFQDRGWSQGWQPYGDQNDSTKSGGSRDPSIRHFILDKEQSWVVEDNLAEKVKERFDVALDAVPAEHRHEVEDMLAATVEEVRRSWPRSG